MEAGDVAIYWMAHCIIKLIQYTGQSDLKNKMIKNGAQEACYLCNKFLSERRTE
jgi:hypothetical protein